MDTTTVRIVCAVLVLLAPLILALFLRKKKTTSVLHRPPDGGYASDGFASIDQPRDRHAVMTVSRALFSFRGRLSRRDYWLKGFLVMLPIGIFNNILASGIDTDGARVLAIIIGVGSLWPGLALLVKRLHDHNRSGWFAATLLIPLANIVFLMWITAEVWFLRGTVGPNRFGEDPVLDPA